MDFVKRSAYEVVEKRADYIRASLLLDGCMVLSEFGFQADYEFNAEIPECIEEYFELKKGTVHLKYYPIDNGDDEEGVLFLDKVLEEDIISKLEDYFETHEW